MSTKQPVWFNDARLAEETGWGLDKRRRMRPRKHKGKMVPGKRHRCLGNRPIDTKRVLLPRANGRRGWETEFRAKNCRTVKAAEDAALKRAEKVLKREIEPATVAYREMKVLFDIDPVTIQRSGVKPEKETILLPRRGGFVEVHPFRTDKIKNLKRGRRGRAQARHPDRITKREALDTYLIGQKTLYKYRSKKKGGEGKKHRALGSTIHTWIQKDGALEISKEDCELIKAWREARPKTAAAKQFLERELQVSPDIRFCRLIPTSSFAA